MSDATPSSDRGTGAVELWIADLRAVLTAERRVRPGRIVGEAEEHLRDVAADLRAGGMSPDDAARAAVERLGSPASYAARFRHPAGFDWVVDTARTIVPIIGWLLVALGVVAVFRDTLDWVFGAGQSARGHGVRVWRTCPQDAGGECIGPFRDYYVSAALVAGVTLVVLGLLVVLIASFLRRRYSDRELFPRWVFWTGEGLLAALGVYLLVGGAVRSSLDRSWYWVPLWATAGVLLLLIAGLAARHEQRLRQLDVRPLPGHPEETARSR